MPQFNFEFRGWHAAVALVALVAFMGVKVWLRVRPVDAAMQDGVRTYLNNEYSGRSAKDVQRILADVRTGLPLKVPELVQRDVAFMSISGRGRILGGVVFVRAEVTVDGGPPPDGRPVRYFQLMHTLSGEWMVTGESDSYQYFTQLMPAF